MKDARIKVFGDAKRDLEAAGIIFKEQQEGVLRLESPSYHLPGTVMYYPGTHKWQYRGRTLCGTVKDFIAFVETGKAP